jgi:hypothetical protein
LAVRVGGEATSTLVTRQQHIIEALEKIRA